MTKPSIPATLAPLDLTGGESVYCINTSQMRKAARLVEQAAPDSVLGGLLDRIEGQLDRNEQAALAFYLISQLNQPRELGSIRPREE